MLSKFSAWNAFSLVGFRAIIAVLFFGLYRHSFKLKHSLGNWIGGMGIISTAVLFINANKMTSTANAIVLQYAMPAVVIASRTFLFKFKPSKKDMLAVTCVMIGVLLCFAQGLGGGAVYGDILALISSVTWAAVFLATDMRRTNAIDYIFTGNLVGCVFLLSIPFDPGIARGGMVGWLIASAMGLCLSAGYYCFEKGMSSGISPAAAAIIANIEPVLNPLWVFLFLGETLGALTILGAVVVLATVTWHSVAKEKASIKGEEYDE